MARPGGVDSAARENPPRPSFPREPLQGATIRWLTQLPADVQPVQLARLFPRIANRLCGLWDNPLLCNRYLTGLLVKPRDGARAGFPVAVEAELADLLGSVDTFGTEQAQSQGRSFR